MSGQVDTPCVTCKWARWYHDSPGWGDCVHPTAVMLTTAPMCLSVRAHTASIAQKTWDQTPDCQSYERRAAP